jgi:23S rRNA (guanosine2251-2'-O)-methyltransferase
MGCDVVRGDVGHHRLADQGAALETTAARVGSEKDLEALLERGNPSAEHQASWQFLVLDGVTDPRNFGACIRSAASFGVHGVIVAKDNAAPLNDAAIKTASGGASLVPVFQVVNLARSLEKLKKAGIWIVGTALEGAGPLGEIDLKGAIAVVMGSEDTGIRQKTRNNCDFLASIPMDFPDLSLNVSVATGICLYEIQRQRSA